MRPARLSALVGTVLIAGMLVPASSSAAVSCQYSAGSKQLKAVATTEVKIVRTSGFNVSVMSENVVVACAGVPPGGATVNNTDTIVVEDQAQADFAAPVIVDYFGGAFAPGSTNEGGSNDEIEFTFIDAEFVHIIGTGAAENMRFGTAGANLNAGDEDGGILTPGVDVDATFTGPNLDFYLVAVSGLGSNDVLSGAGGLTTGSTSPWPLFFEGGFGDDQLTGGESRDGIGGGAGGEPGNDELSGGDGSDVLAADLGSDEVAGGAGVDTAAYYEINSLAGVTVDLATTGQQNTIGGGLDTLTGVENLHGSPFFDKLYGDAGSNELEGAQGGDTLDPRGGADTVFGSAGDDVLMLRDGDSDTASCGSETDTVTADVAGVDTINADCESVDFAPFTPPADEGGGGDGSGGGAGSDSKLDVLLTAPRKQVVLDPNGLVVSARCPDEDCEAKARALIRLPGRSANTLRATVRPVKSRAVRESLTAGVAEKLRLLLTKKGARLAGAALDERSRLPAVVRIVATDAAGNSGTASVRAKVVG